MATKKIAYAIARESADDRTLQNQYANLYQVAKDEGYEIVAEFGDNVSGDVTKNDGQDPNFIEELRLAISKRKPDAIFCYWIDRLTRTTYKQGAYLNEFSVVPKIPICFTREKKWTIDPNTKKINDEFLARLASDQTPQKERENITARTRPQREKLGSEGYFIGHISDGYCVEESWGVYEDGRRRKIKKIIKDKERAPVIEDIYRYYLNGESTDKIAAILNANNVATANKYRSEHHDKFGYKAKYIGKDKMTYERKNATWSGALVAQVLCNEWYKGIRHYQKKELHHDYIIEPADWEEVKRIREERKVSFRSMKEPSKHVFLLSNLFYCGKCGCKMYGHYTGLNNHYYCSSLENSKKKCGLKGICKENVEGIIYDILIKDAYDNVLGGTADDSITSFFKLSKKKEKSIKEGISNNEKIIKKLTEENETHEKSIDFLIAQQSLHADNATRVERYEAQINQNEQAIESNKKKILKYQVENKNYNRMLTANVNVKQILKNIEETKDLNVIRQFFKTAIDRVYIFNTEKNNSIIRICDKKGDIAECVYSASRIKGKYIPLVGLHYNEKTNLIELNEYPVIASNLYLFSLGFDFERGYKEIEALHEELNQSYTYIREPISVDSYIELLKKSEVAFPYQRLEGLSDLALLQREHYRQWRKKYNTGRPKGESYVIHNETYDEINLMRKKLYNRRYKIKIHKSLSDEEKKKRLEEIKRELDALTIQVPLIKPRKKREKKVDVLVAPTTILDD